MTDGTWPPEILFLFYFVLKPFLPMPMNVRPSEILMLEYDMTQISETAGGGLHQDQPKTQAQSSNNTQPQKFRESLLITLHHGIDLSAISKLNRPIVTSFD